MTISRALLLVGSAKSSGTSTSEALGRYVFDRLGERGVMSSITTVNRSAIVSDAGRLPAAIAETDLFVLATPVYVDSLPYLVTRAFEAIAAARARVRPPCAFAAIVNCGFPESRQCDTAVAIARAFARRAGFTWAGGLALGEGGAIDGRRLEDVGRLTHRVRGALDAAAAALAGGQPVPEEAIAQMARPLVPARFYTLAGNVGWRRQAARNHVRSRLGARPYA